MPELHPPFIDLAVEVLKTELTSLGHGPITDEGFGGYLKIGDVRSFVLAVNETSDGQIKIEFQSGLESGGYEHVGRVGIMNLRNIAQEIHETIERHQVALGVYQKKKEDAERDVVLGKSRLQAEFRLRRNRQVDVDGKVDHQHRPRFQVVISDLSEDEARAVLETLAEGDLVGLNDEDEGEDQCLTSIPS